MNPCKILDGLIRCGTGLILLATAGSALASNPHYVFAHYMTCFATYGENTDGDIAGFERDILDAQAAGVDGFALDMPEWNGPDWYYTTNVELMYEAAEELGTGFKLFFSVEMTNTASIVDMISTYAGSSNTFHYNGKVVVSTFGQNNANWANGVIAPLASNGIPVFFVPFFWPNDMAELPTYQDGVSILKAYSNILDGLFLFGAAGVPSALAQCNSNYNIAVHAAGKLYMAGMTHHYWGSAQPSNGRRYCETDGGEGTILQWNSIIANQPDWVEIVTWDDFNESTYSSPVNNPGQYEAQVQTPYRNCHAGYLALSQYYIKWYKTGRQPPINQDCLFYFYRTHPMKAVATDTNDIPVTSFSGDIADVIYNTVFLTASAQLEINSGGSLSTNTLAAGIQSLRTPFTPGPQSFILRRNGTAVLSLQGPPILSQITNYDFFPASGYTTNQPAAPQNLFIKPN